MQTLAHSTAFLCGMWDLREGLFSSFRWGLTKELLQFLYISWWFRFFTEIHFWKWESDPSVWPFIQILPYGTFEKSIINSIAFLTSGGLYEEWKTCMENSNNFLIVWCKKLSITVDDSKCNRLWYILYIYIYSWTQFWQWWRSLSRWRPPTAASRARLRPRPPQARVSTSQLARWAHVTHPSMLNIPSHQAIWYIQTPVSSSIWKISTKLFHPKSTEWRELSFFIFTSQIKTWFSCIRVKICYLALLLKVMVMDFQFFGGNLLGPPRTIP